MFKVWVLSFGWFTLVQCLSTGFGKSSIDKGRKPLINSSRKTKGKNLLQNLNDTPAIQQQDKKKGYTYVKSDQDILLNQLAAASALSPIGRVVAESLSNGNTVDPFWELMPSLIESKFPHVKHDNLHRVAGFIRHTLNPHLQKEEPIMNDPWRPLDELHAYMPNLEVTKPFYDPIQFDLCHKLSENVDVITQEYNALLQDMAEKQKDRFQSVTSMNYDAGWKTLVLFYNGHRIQDFPYHLCPVTTQILESVPLAGRIAGFNRQMANSGIPKHTDGNNMWLTCQMGIQIPEGNKAHIRVGPITRFWNRGECLVYVDWIRYIFLTSSVHLHAHRLFHFVSSVMTQRMSMKPSIHI